MDSLQKPSFIRIARSFGVEPRKKLGQHFLINEKVLEKIVELADVTKKDVVIEIGSGIGNLTWHIAKRAKQVYAIEKDKKLKTVILRALDGFNNVTIIIADALKIDLRKEISEHNLPNKMVANLPYNIASTLVVDFLRKNEFITEYVVMVQKEVADRLFAKPGEEAYSSLSLKIKALADVRRLMNLSPGNFWPPPEVESSLIYLKRNVKILKVPLFFALVEAAFSHKRKKILNSLLASTRFKYSKEMWQEMLLNAGINPASRAEEHHFESFSGLLHEVILKEKK